MEEPGLDHWNAAKNILKYLRFTHTMLITYRKHNKMKSEVGGYSDAIFAGDRYTRRSTSRYVFPYSGGAISWRSKRQKATSQSTMEAEYVYLSYAARQLVWLRRLCGIPRFNASTGPFISIQITRVQFFCKNGVMNDRTKQIDVNFRFIPELLKNGTIKVKHISAAHDCRCNDEETFLEETYQMQQWSWMEQT